jgi:protein kinase-like protein/curli production assembly/transport component CsgG
MSSGIKNAQGLQADVDGLETPPMIDGYRFVRQLGRGGMGVVWEAIQLGTARSVAVKFMGAALLSEGARKRFSREVKLAARLTHPHIVRIYASGLHQNAYYYAMELVHGVPLDEAIRAGMYPWEKTVGLMAEVCDAVDYAHSQGVIHRDLKPANILISEEGSPHILDFGLAKEFALDAGDVAESFLVSSEGDRAGTPVYMSPEQAAGKIAVTPASDVYSIGAILYHLLTGRYAHDPNLPRMDLYQRIATTPAPALCEVAKGLPKSLEAVLKRAMAVDPRERFDSAGELGEALRGCLTRPDSHWTPATGASNATGERRARTPNPSAGWVRGKRVWIAALLAAAVVTVALGAWMIRGRGGEEELKKTVIVPGQFAADVSVVAVAPVDVDATAGTKLSATRARGLAETIRQKMEQRLAGVPDVRVAERARLDTVLREKGLPASNSTDAGKLAEGAKAIGASELVAPAIVDLDSKSQKFTGYGVSTSRISATASLLVRVIDVPTSTVKYSATFEGRAVKESSTFSPEGSEDVESEAVRDALNRALADQALTNALKK